MIYNIGFVQRL